MAPRSFVCSGRAKEVDHLVAVDKVELGECENATAVKRRLEREGGSGERLDGGELGHCRASSWPIWKSWTKLCASSSAAKPAEVIDTPFADAVEYGGDDLQCGIYSWYPWQAKRWPTAW